MSQLNGKPAASKPTAAKRTTAKGKNTTAGKSGRPTKPYESFPLSPHASGTWQKKILGKIHYFGRWGRVVGGEMARLPGDGWKEALAEYERAAADLHAGREPSDTPEPDALTLADLANHFLTAKTRQLEAGELSPRMLADYRSCCDRLIDHLGKARGVAGLRIADFDSLRVALSKRYGPVRLSNEIQRTRTVFKYGYECGLLAVPMRFGPTFKKPSKKVLRVHRAESGKKLFTADECRRVINAAGVPLRAMVLLGLNAGFGNGDCGRLPLSAIDLGGGWVAFFRPKTGLERKAKLWPETVVALREALAARPTPKDPADKDLAFVTKYGKAWASAGDSDAVSLMTGRLLRGLGIVRQGVGFYALRHTFRTVADGAKDANAIRLIMGHADDSIDANYTHQIDDARLVAVAEHVRGWLFPDAAA